ncbi:MAG TPA: NADP-specific glutamate dehydrogenase [Bacilli bacterium]|nr:NADP-specific glutamate dehydrogenase [Bacilli bacterium]HPS18513.1 NADP-specific glutamate dehydrogenase [Bacilli bacterium]
MYKSLYLNTLLTDVKSKYRNEPEFIQAVEEFFDSMDFLVEKDPRIEKNAILERIIVPERTIEFRVPWIDDQNKIRVNTGYRVQFNSAIGPYKGGMRFDKSVNVSILKFLGFEQTFKNSLTGLPMGGGKGGSDFDPRGKSDAEVMRFCQSFMNEFYRYIGPNTDVPAGDLGFGAREIGYMVGQYKKIVNEWGGVFTGKNVSYGGSLARPEATGYGLCYFVQEILKTFLDTDFKGKKVIISGSGKVGSMALKKAHDLGAIVVGMSDINGYVSDPKGLKVEEIIELAKAKGEFTKDYIANHPGVKHSDRSRDLWNVPCEIAMPCATQGEINIDNAKQLKANGVFLVAEGANMPCDLEAIRFFNENNILFSPGKASNAGGVAVSGLEMTQNAMHLSWTFEEVDEKLKGIMKSIFQQCYTTAAKFNQPKNLALGANIAGFLKVMDAMLAQGVC